MEHYILALQNPSIALPTTITPSNHNEAIIIMQKQITQILQLK